MSLLRKALNIILFTSIIIWLLMLLTLFLPVTGLLTRSVSSNIDSTVLSIFQLSGFVASASCFIFGLDMLEVLSTIAGKPGHTRTDPVRSTTLEETRYQTEVQIFDTKTKRLEIPVKAKRLKTLRTKHKLSWKREEILIRGRLQSIFRNPKTGRFIKNPKHISRAA